MTVRLRDKLSSHLTCSSKTWNYEGLYRVTKSKRDQNLLKNFYQVVNVHPTDKDQTRNTSLSEQ